MDRYIGALFAPEDAALAGVPQSLVDAGMPQISVTATEGRLLHVLALTRGARSILEIGGSWTRSWRPKITVRRRSLRNTKYPPSGSKYWSISAAGTSSVTVRLRYRPWRASATASWSTSVA